MCGYLILTTRQPVKGYFMPRGLEIADIVRLNLNFLCSFFLKGFFAHSPVEYK